MEVTFLLMVKKILKKAWGPNFLTGLRCFLGLWMGIRLQYHLDWTLMVVFSCIMLTDVLDGWWARSYKITSTLGTILDPLADKIMIMSVIFGLVKRTVLPKWFFYLTLVKEVTLIIGSLYGAKSYKHFPLKAILWGKIAMFSQCVLILLAMSRILYPWHHIGYDVYLWIVTLTMSIAWLIYVFRAKGHLL